MRGRIRSRIRCCGKGEMVRRRREIVFGRWLRRWKGSIRDGLGLRDLDQLLPCPSFVPILLVLLLFFPSMFFLLLSLLLLFLNKADERFLCCRLL